MLNDCKFGNNADITEHLENAIKTIQDGNKIET